MIPKAAPKPIEHELVCPSCSAPPLPVYPARCACGWTGEVADLVRSGRTRPRQFKAGKYPEVEPWR